MQLFYVVRPGDTLIRIAKRWELPVKSLIAANNLTSPYTISVGQQLSIPPGVNKYRVKSGDSVDRISQTFGVPASLIAETNRLSPPYVLAVGQLLQIPPGVSYYVAQPGDTLSKIANRFNVTTDGQINPGYLQKVNELPSTGINPGMKLVVPYAPTGYPGFLAYTSNRGGQYDIWVYNPRTGENKLLTNGLGDVFSKPVWSPDSNRIAFVGKDRIIYIIYAETGLIAGIDQLEVGVDFSLDWSPDSSSLAYVARGMILLYNATLHEAETIMQSGASDVSWFPSGTELLFQAPDSSGISQLFRSNTYGTAKKQITRNTNGPLHDTHLSPDGTFAFYTTPGASVSIIYTVEIATGAVHEVKGGPNGKNYFPEWSPDSLRIAYSATAFEDRGYFAQIRTVDRQGSEDRIWAISNCFSTPVTWSPDGRRIAYLSGCKEQEFATEMWVIDLGHPVPIRLIEGVNIVSVQWSPTSILDLLKKEFTSEKFGVNFQYPASWQRVNDERYEGDDGFFQISALVGSNSIDRVCHDVAYQKSMPYGSAPQIIKTQNSYEQSCTILPSADQPIEMKGQAAFITEYPSPQTIDGVSYNYFILWADKEHINEISTTIMFLP
ncbi:LysM peptidoglycan-binding domain-containing protein [Sporosarcina sp. ANT_H38]|uniref:LysM peptidoglycan-binding domain-containing protein n=1 Tax=Sporosarcina sp. ANT_H38 TaxID=2597358 RepID=UPI0011F38939|nr:LysM peptidoglycan-binding domain-containing protein [Sporosarcina sp. ANT_H38]KAA0966208.1 LysM peptidoglycan-binding domain-containing protein [Sporosarcina sp. ANT_H38]